MYMLLNVTREENGLVDGTHIQWCCVLDLARATQLARDTEKVNGNRIKVAVVDELYDSYAMHRTYKGLKRMDIQAPPKIPVVKRPNSNTPMTDTELAAWANTVYRKGGGKAPFRPSDFPERLKGHHCSCGVDENGYTKGVFTLCSLSSEEVGDSGKAYMICDVCGAYSHL